MAAAVTVDDRTLSGTKRITFGTVTFDSSYATGGEAVSAAQLGLDKVHAVVCNVKAVGGTINVANVTYDIANGKFKVYDETPAEVADTSTLATLVVNYVAFGI